MQNLLLRKKQKDTIKITLVKKDNYNSWLKKQNSLKQKIYKVNGFKKEVGKIYVSYSKKGNNLNIDSVVAIYDPNFLQKSIASIASKLPEGYSYYIENIKLNLNMVLGWLLISYRFDKYKSKKNRQKLSFISS